MLENLLFELFSAVADIATSPTSLFVTGPKIVKRCRRQRLKIFTIVADSA
jgi:hypothetical protein